MTPRREEIASAAIAWELTRLNAETLREVRDEVAHAPIVDPRELAHVHRDYRRAAALAGVYLRALRRLIALDAVERCR